MRTAQDSMALGFILVIISAILLMLFVVFSGRKRK